MSSEDFDVDNNCDFEHAHDKQIDDACDTTIVSSTSSIQQNINPPSPRVASSLVVMVGVILSAL